MSLPLRLAAVLQLRGHTWLDDLLRNLEGAIPEISRIVGAVLVQALILYVGYGWLESAVGGKLLAAIRRGS